MSWRDGIYPPLAGTELTYKELIELPRHEFKKVMALAGVSSPQPKPTGAGVDITAAVVADLQERSRVGRKKYGDVLRSYNGRDAMLDAYQEVLDLCCYLRQVIEERPK